MPIQSNRWQVLSAVAFEAQHRSSSTARSHARRPQCTCRTRPSGMSDSAIQLELAAGAVCAGRWRRGRRRRVRRRRALSVRCGRRSGIWRARATGRRGSWSSSSGALGRVTRGAIAGSGRLPWVGPVVRVRVRHVPRRLRADVRCSGRRRTRRRTRTSSSTRHAARSGRRRWWSSGSQRTRSAQANDEALEFTSSIGALFRPLGILGKQAADLSITLVKRGVDLSSFYNTDVKQVARGGPLGDRRGGRAAPCVRRPAVRGACAGIGAQADRQGQREGADRTRRRCWRASRSS